MKNCMRYTKFSIGNGRVPSAMIMMSLVRRVGPISFGGYMIDAVVRIDNFFSVKL